MKRILVVEDDADLLNLLQFNLEKEGYAVLCSPTGKGVIATCLKERPDLILLDVMLPETAGLDLCREIRANPDLAHIPVIFLTARASEADRIVGLEIGANDYIVKPFFVRELIARIKIQLRPPLGQIRNLKADGLHLDRPSCRVWLNGSEISLTATEFRLLEFLMSRPGIVFSREQLLDAVWGHDRAVTDRTVDVYVLRLRQKVDPEAASGQGYIRSVRGFGYCFKDPAAE
ncbi:MAG: response regulator transcription factor [Acidobacteria bacterium]|nr:response regulator transcription factor [Acidobacteriota bacterium]